ncbi:hypothetical protein GCM10023168_03360 [Fodinibacter luteus]|uniref:Uncharacterized protein n=1 Tax=Fodinibacter luteus TaxID=552064 RepID=A0ABP8JY41_9MICO
MELLEGRPLAGDAFDQVGEAARVILVRGDGKDVDLEGHRCLSWQPHFVDRAKDGLGADDDDLAGVDDLACGTNGVLELVAAHQRLAMTLSRSS